VARTSNATRHAERGTPNAKRGTRNALGFLVLPYQFVLTAGCVICAVALLFDRRASLRVRLVVLALAAASFSMPASIPGRAAAITLQLAVGLFVLLRREALRR
jgi:hypothetical protein